MQGNGNPDIGSFEWLFSRRISRLEAQGAPGDDIDSLKARARQITQVLVEFRTQRRTLGDSGKYTRDGLRDVLSEQAVKAAGAIRRTQDDTILREHIRQVETKLGQKTKADPATDMVNFWRQMEISALYDRVGITIVNPATGEITFDTVKGNNFYQQAMQRGDVAAMEALEQWPVGLSNRADASPVSPELMAEGRQKRLALADPVNAKKLEELRNYEQALQITVGEALQELREFLPVDDPIARMAGAPQPPEPDEAA